MSKGKRIRERGKIKFSAYFKKFNEGDSVAIVNNLEVRSAFPKRILGKTGKISGARGNYKLIKLNDGNKVKTFIIHPVHLKKIQN